MKKIIKQFSLLISVIALTAFGVLNPVATATTPTFSDALRATEGTGVSQKTDLKPTDLVTAGLKYLMYAIGVISVVMIIIGGIRYATSGGSADKVKSAKNTILYACVGLAVALLALAIVTFVQNDVVGGL